MGWHVLELEEVLKDAGFEQTRSRHATPHADRRDYVPIKLEDEVLGTLELEASRHRRPSRKDQGEAIRPKRRQSVVVESDSRSTQRHWKGHERRF